MFEGSAVSAMAALRGQLEERLLQTEDYRALKALDKAIADVETFAAAKAGGFSAPQVRANPDVAGHEQSLQQKIAERFNSAAA